MAAKDIDQLVKDLREGKIDASQFKDELNEVVDEAAEKATESVDAGAKSERIDSAARKAARL